MKILLRNHENQTYVWKTAKFNGNRFVVDGMEVYEIQVVSVLNDNRKSYVKCSSCGKIFPKNGNKFRQHQIDSSSVAPCLKCSKVRSEEVCSGKKKYIANADGTFKERFERTVKLYCRQSTWTHWYLDSEEALKGCPLRMCRDAYQKEITDTFTKYPGIFDDIITVDQLFDKGYDNRISSDTYGETYVIDDDFGLYAFVNKLGIVDRFTFDYCGDYFDLYYSKKYGKVFTVDIYEKYTEWDYEDTEVEEKVNELIKELYK